MLSGIADPKWTVSAAQVQTGLQGVPRKLSPFDESALECALKLRDQDPAVRIHAWLIGSGAASEEVLARSVAAYRLNQMACLRIDEQLRWDAHAFARCLGRWLGGKAERMDAVLMGREFGDLDEGLIAPCLAEVLRWRFAGLIQEVTQKEGQLMLMRERGEVEEHLSLPSPFLVSITNDKRNRLRHPLMKNLATANKERFAATELTLIDARVRPLSSEDCSSKPGAAACQMIGGNVDAQADTLAVWLRARLKR